MIPESQLVGVEKELAKKLRAMFDNDNFVEGIRELLESDLERQWMIEGIDEGELQNVRDVTDYALQIDEDREEERDD